MNSIHNISDQPIQKYSGWLKKSINCTLSLAICLCFASCIGSRQFGKEKYIDFDTYAQSKAFKANPSDLKYDFSVPVSITEGKDWLQYAVESGSVTNVKAVLDRITSDREKGFQYINSDFPNCIDPKSKKTALCYAIEAGYQDIVKLLIQHDAIDIHKMGNGLTTLLTAFNVQNEKMAWLLLNECPKYKELDISSYQPYSRETSLHLSIRYGFKRVTKVLLDNLPLDSLLAKDAQFRTPLHTAAYYHRQDEFRLLFHRIEETLPKEEAILKLFELDSNGYPVFTCAYMSKRLEPFYMHNTLPACKSSMADNRSMFKFMLKTISHDLNPYQWDELLQGIRNFPNSDSIYQMASKYRQLLEK